ncbi:toll-like receptor 3 isoform X2 [Chelonia mydas]|uniref:toll-like receptor 3 isoform X2 n=1 Tax=Chelonia mydas TaxID=8469 RepID=UPI001CA89693|nr:toll-like receptor 3 isoform X2 [Chelonia mydas]
MGEGRERACICSLSFCCPYPCYALWAPDRTMRDPLPSWACLSFSLLTFSLLCVTAENQCKIRNQVADCSHLKLKQIPSDLPINITALDISHNQLNKLPPANLTKYSQLIYLDAGSNSLSKLQPELCQTLPLLKVLKLQHNQLRELTDNVFASCASLTELNLGSNIIEIKGNPFKNLKNLNILDVSHNRLLSTKLGSQPQLESLRELVLSENKITELKKEELDFLSNASLNRLDLSSNPLKEFHTGCLHAIGNLYGLVLNNVELGENLTEKLCLELSGTRIQNLSLSQIQLSFIHKSTFHGLQTTNLTALNLSKNYLNMIENDSLTWLSSLENLNLEDNRIYHLFSHSLYGLSNVKYLNLRRSRVRKIDDFSFRWLSHLEYLLIDSNSFQEITPNMFTGLDNLKYLSLCNWTNGLQIITNKTFSSLANSTLQFLNLTKSRITKIEGGAFSWLGHLKILDLGLNEINQVLTGHEFKGLQNIEDIYLSYNKELTLTSESFAFVPSLRKLMLRKVACSNLDLSPSPFHPLRNLTILDISNNNLANVKDDLFDGLHKLEILDLQHNNLARLWKHANPGGPVLFLKDLLNLHILNLKSNGLDEIPVQVFKGLFQLRSLDLGSNNLNLLPASLFDDQISLNSLILQKNLITSVEEKVFGSAFKNLKELEMDSNPFDCTCESISWFVNWLNVTQTNIPGLDTHYLCNTPPKYHSTLVMYFDISPCKDSAPFQLLYIISTTVIMLFIFIVILIHFEGWRIAFYWNVSVNRVLGFTEIDRQQEEFDYDAYIIHARRDRNWVSKNFIPLEENDQSQIRFCLEERDFEAGISEFEATINSIKRSRKIIFVVTDHLLKDPWCKKFKVYHAVQQAIEQSRDSIILIFLHDIPDYKLNHALCLRRGMFKSRCILDWPAQKERVNAFHQQLKMALKSSSNIH